MSATMSLPKTLDGLETIKTLLTTFNLKDVVTAQEELRKQLKLTQEQEGEYAAAKAFIAQYKSLDKALKDREDALLTAKAQLDLDKKQHVVHVAGENTRLETFSLKLDKKDKDQADIDRKQRTEAESLAGQRLDYERQHREAMGVIQSLEVQNKTAAAGNIAEAARLKEWEASLKRKAELIKQQMAKILE